MERKKLLSLALFALTILWLIASYQHVRAYNQLIEEDRERLGDELAELLDYEPVWLYGWGELLFFTGLLIAIAWIIIIYEVVKKVKKRIKGGSKGVSKFIPVCILLFLLINVFVIIHLRSLPVEANQKIPLRHPSREAFHMTPFQTSTEEQSISTVEASNWEAPSYCWFNAIDLLFVCDEELAEHEEIVDVIFPNQYIWKPSTWKIENILFPLLQERFLNDAGISINFNGWLYFDSNDSEHEIDFLLIEAMNETGWIPQSIYRETNHTVIDAYGRPVTLTSTKRMDILFVLTMQSTTRTGFAMTKSASQSYSNILGKTVYWDACILKYWEGDRRLSIQLMQHELSHLFGLYHCPNQCCMHPDLVFLIYVSWCSSCRNYMRAKAVEDPPQYPCR